MITIAEKKAEPGDRMCLDNWIDPLSPLLINDERGEVMKIVVIGGTGLIGSKVVAKLKQKGHEASRRRRTRASTPSPAKAWLSACGC